MNNDLISRSALLELGNFMRINKVLADWDELDNKTKKVVLRYAQKIKRIILDAPTVDAVEVVRCGECKHIENSPYGRYCTVWHGHNGMGDEGFCNYGERKTE